MLLPLQLSWFSNAGTLGRRAPWGIGFACQGLAVNSAVAFLEAAILLPVLSLQRCANVLQLLQHAGAVVLKQESKPNMLQVYT